MSFRVSVCWLAVATVGWCGVATGLGQTNQAAAGPPPAPLPRNEDRLKQLEEELSKSLESFSPKNMLQDAVPPSYQPPPPVSPRRRAREQAERRKNWMFPDAEETPGTAAEEWLKDTSLGTKEKKKSDLEVFYEQLNRQRSLLMPGQARLKPDAAFVLPGTKDSDAESDDSKLPDRLEGPAKKLKQLLGGSPTERVFNPGGSPRGLSDLFNPTTPDTTLTPDEIKAHKAYLEDYQRIFDSPAPVNPLTSVKPAPATTVNPTVPLYGGLDTLTSGARPLGTPGTALTLANPGTMPDPTATVLNQWNPMYAPPKIEPPKPPPLFTTPVEAPRRRF